MRLQAAHYYGLNLARLDEEGADGDDKVAALLYLSRHALQAGRLADAEALCGRLADYGGPSKDQAKALLREIQAAVAAAAAATPALGASAAAGARGSAGPFPGWGRAVLSPGGGASATPGSIAGRASGAGGPGSAAIATSAGLRGGAGKPGLTPPPGGLASFLAKLGEGEATPGAVDGSTADDGSPMAMDDSPGS